MSGTVRASVDIQKMSKRKYVHGKCIKLWALIVKCICSPLSQMKVLLVIYTDNAGHFQFP